jgi:Tol biopolymer transport system component
MQRLSRLILSLAVSGILASPAVAQSIVPEVFAPGVISGGTHDAAPAFSPDGKTVFFSRSNPGGSSILVATRQGTSWSSPRMAPFSGEWSDMEPAMSPDGRYMVFVSNRPAEEGGSTLDGYFNGKAQPGHGGNLWRVDRTPFGWSEPHHLSDAINEGGTIFAPSISADGSLTFMKPDSTTKKFRLYHAKAEGTGYATPVPLPFSTGEWSDVDPAMAPDESFLVFGSGRAPAKSMDLFVVFRDGAGWGKPVHLGDDVNSPGSDAESRLSPDLKTLYFSSERLVPQHFPRTRAEGERTMADANAWNNGLYNIWQVSLPLVLARARAPSP